MQRSGGVVPAVLALLALAAGCAETDAPAAAPSAPRPSPSSTPTRAEDCPGLAAAMVDTVQRVVDEYADLPAGALTTRPRPETDLQGEARGLRRRAETLDCDADELDGLLADELTRLRAEGPVAEAVAATFRSQLVSDVADPSDSPPEQRRVSSAAELVRATTALGSGSTVTLEPGEYELEQPLVLLRPVTLRGAGRDETRLVSAAAGPALVYLGDGRLGLEELTIGRDSAAPASVVLVRSGSYRLRQLRVTGGRAVDGQGGFGLVLRTGGADDERPTRSEVRDTAVVDNEGGGLAVAGTEAPALVDLELRGNGGCAVCFLEQAAGSLRGGQVADGEVGIRVEDDARPTVTGSSVADAAEVGVLLGGDTTATVRDTEVAGDTPVGVLVRGGARPRLRSTTVTSTGEAGLVYAGNAGGRATDTRLSGQRIAAQISDRARPELIGTVAGDVGEAAVVFAGSSAGRAESTSCPDAPAGIVLVESTDPELADNDCPVVDDRG